MTIPANLLEWLDAFPGSMLPTNYDRLAKMVRKHFELTHDEPRHMKRPPKKNAVVPH